MGEYPASSLPLNSWPGKLLSIWRRGYVSRSKPSDFEPFYHQKRRSEHLAVDRSPHLRSNSTVQKRLISLVINILSLPLWLIPRRGRPVRTKALHELHPLAYLDALRGYLALIIFTAHTMNRFWKWIPDSVLSIPWLQFPFRGGFASLDIFFWISGYAVTYRLVGFVQTKKSDQLLDALTSSIFRRYLRLFLPILPVTLFTAIAVRTGLAIPPENRRQEVTGNVIWWWVKDSGHVMNPFTPILGYWTGETGSKLIDPFWSLSAEFRSSMMLFLVVTGTCKMSTEKRKLFLLLCIPAFMCWQAQWAIMAFLGMWFAESRQQRRRSQTSPQTTSRSSLADNELIEKGDLSKQRTTSTTFQTLVKSLGYGTNSRERLRTVALVILFLYSFIVFKDPYDTDKMKLFPHNVLNKFVPKHWHGQMRMHMHLCIASMMMLYPLDHVPMLQRPLLTPFSQYLGELSFGIYAVHFPIRWIVWEERYVKWQTERHGKDAFNQFWIAFPGWFGMAILVLWAADLFRRLDMQVVRFCKFLEMQLFE